MTSEIITVIISAMCGGGLGWIINWSANKRKANGEATQTEAEAMKSVQDVYQQTLADQQTYIEKLKEARDHLIVDREDLRQENNELRRRLNELEGSIKKLEDSVARNARMVEATKIWMCGRIGCQQRIVANLGTEGGQERVEITK